MGLRAAVNTVLPIVEGVDSILTWGLDFEHEDLKQDGKQYTRQGLVYTPTGRILELGPDIQTNTMALFAQSSWYMGPWTLRGGVRQQWMKSNVKDSISYGDIQLTGAGNVLPGAKLKYDATLFNIGAVRSLGDAQEVFLNFSQGFTLPDLQRFLRDALSTFDVRTLSSPGREAAGDAGHLLPGAGRGEPGAQGLAGHMLFRTVSRKRYTS